MGTRITESRRPDGFGFEDLGQVSVSKQDARYALVSYLTSPLHTHSTNNYVVFVIDDAPADEYRWSIWDGVETIQATTTAGDLSYVPIRRGMLHVVVDVLVGGVTRVTLALKQAVDAGVLRTLDIPELQGDRVVKELTSGFGEPATTRELIEDFRQYIFDAAQLTNIRVTDPITGAPVGGNGVPSAFVASVAYKEMLCRPKELTAERPWYGALDAATFIGANPPMFSVLGSPFLPEWPTDVRQPSFIRDQEIIESIRLIDRKQFDDGTTSLGVCQMQPCLVAMILGWTPWREQKKTLNESVVEAQTQRVIAYKELPSEKKVDILNLLRFPKSNIRLCAHALAAYKNRANRWIEQSPEDFASNSEGLGIIATEYNRGPTDSPAGSAKPADYGTAVANIYNAYTIQRLFEDIVISLPSFSMSSTIDPTQSANQDDAKRLKQRLRELGFSWLTVDGTLEDKTLRAIKLFKSIVAGKTQVEGNAVVSVPGNIEDAADAYLWLRAPNAPFWHKLGEGSRTEGYINHKAKNTHGTSWLAETIRAAAAEYVNSYLNSHQQAAVISIHEMTTPEGGQTEPHQEHQTGLNCDLILPRKDGGSGGGITYKDTQIYDIGAMRAQLQALKTQPLSDRILFNDDTLIAEGLCIKCEDHDNHAHLRIKAPIRMELTES